MAKLSFRCRSVLTAFTFVAASSMAYAGSLTVYTALEEDEIAAYVAAAKKDIPDITLNVLRLSTGDIGARILAEANNPQHDVIWGWAVTNMLDPRILELLEPYKAKGSDELPERYKDSEDRWFAATGYMAAFCVNTVELEARNLPVPTSWKDLTNPAYKGEIVMPSPVSSGTGYLQIAGLLQGMGEDDGWNYLKELDKNMAQYTRSGSRPCKAARTGEYMIGISLAFAGIQSVEEGFPVKLVIPSDNVGFELEASAIMKTSNNKEDARRFMDWTLGESAAALYGHYKEIVTIPGTPMSKAAEMAGLPADLSDVLYPMDFAQSAKDRGRILDIWQKDIGR